MVFAVVVSAILVYGLISSMLGSLLPALGFTGPQNATLALMQASGLTLAALLAGPFIDIRGKKVGMLSGLAALMIALWSMPSANGNFALAAGLWFVLGLGGGLLGTTTNSLLSDIGGPRRSAVLNAGNLFFGLGLMITPFLASNVFAGSVRGSCFFAATLVTVMLLVTVIIRIPPPNHGNPFRWPEAWELLKNPMMHLLALFACLYVASEVGLSNWLVKFLIAEGIPKENALKIMSLGFALGLLTGRLLASRLLIRVAPIQAVIGSAIAMTVTTSCLLVAGPGETSTAITVFFVGMSMAAAFPTLLGVAGDVFPNATGTVMGLVITSGWVGLAISSRLIGTIAGADESNLPQALLLFPVFSAALIGVGFAIRGRLSKKS